MTCGRRSSTRARAIRHGPGQERDASSPKAIRSDDLFFGGSQPDWVDLDRVQVPSADEQQRLLANLITGMQQDRMPLPRFWYLPWGLKAAVVLTGDDHGTASTRTQVTTYRNMNRRLLGGRLAVRALHFYVFPDAPLSDSRSRTSRRRASRSRCTCWISGRRAARRTSATNCNNDRRVIAADSSIQLATFATKWPSAASPATNRSHCIVWSDWVGTPLAEVGEGIRLDTNYYYWPGAGYRTAPGSSRVGLPAALRRTPTAR